VRARRLHELRRFFRVDAHHGAGVASVARDVKRDRGDATVPPSNATIPRSSASQRASPDSLGS
jgi:hypothetical protein